MSRYDTLGKVPIHRRKGKGVWGNNRFKGQKSHEKRTKGGRIIPKTKRCLICKARVFNHHKYCDVCWGVLHEKVQMS